MNILLVLPNANMSVVNYHLLPIGVAYISASLRQAGHNVKFIDLETEKNGKARLDGILQGWKPDFMGFSIIPRYFTGALKTAAYVRNFSADIKLVAGGILPSVFPEKFFDDFDFVIRGDGELPFVNLISGDSLCEIEGLCYFDNVKGEVVDNGVNYYPFVLEELPFPDYETIPLEKYATPPLGIFLKTPSYPMFSTRGCGGQCTFCTSDKFNKKHRVRDPEDVLAEIELANARYKLKEVYFMDATFSYNMEYTHRLCDEFIKSGNSLIWHCGTRIDKVDKALLKHMNAAGCRSIAFALESADQDILKKIRKPYDLKKAIDVLNYCDQLGLFIKHNFMFGLPGETEQSLRDTLNLALSIPADIAYFHLFNFELTLQNATRLPMEEEYWKSLEKRDELGVKGLFPIVEEKVIKKYFFKAYLKFYFRPSFLWRSLRRRINRIAIFYNLKALFPKLFLFAIPKLFLLSLKYIFVKISNQKEV